MIRIESSRDLYRKKLISGHSSISLIVDFIHLMDLGSFILTNINLKISTTDVIISSLTSSLVLSV